MKTEQEINHARAIIREQLKTPCLNDAQRALLAGMLNALVWCVDGPNATTLERLLAGEPLAAGQDPREAFRMLDAFIERHR